jgi:hypothetical protein
MSRGSYLPYRLSRAILDAWREEQRSALLGQTLDGIVETGTPVDSATVESIEWNDAEVRLELRTPTGELGRAWLPFLSSDGGPSTALRQLFTPAELDRFEEPSQVAHALLGRTLTDFLVSSEDELLLQNR